MSNYQVALHGPLQRQTTRQMHMAAIERVIADMRRRPDAPLDLKEMANIANASRCHFDRVFHEIVGVTPRQFQTALRLHAAARLLLTTETKVTDICFEVGYESLGSFISRFTRTFGIAPQKMRDLARHIDLPWGDRLTQTLDHIFPAPEPPFLHGFVRTEREINGPIFIGLFDTPMPVNAPVACVVVHQPGSFRMGSVPDGDFYLLGVAVPWNERPLDFLLDESILRGGLIDRPLHISGGITGGHTSFVLREARPIDPPINLALPFLIVTRALDLYCGLERRRTS
jgi:AraC family transcriptional regulator